MTPEEIREVEEFLKRMAEGKEQMEKPAEPFFPQPECEDGA